MKKTITMLITLCALLSVNAQSIRSSDIDKIVYEEMIRQNLPGLAIGVYKNGTINHAKGYGYIDVNNRKPINSNTPFRWASISKTITAVAAFQVDEKYRNFSVNDNVIKHYPYWTSKISKREVADKNRKNNITIKHLLTHRSGINHYTRGTKDVKNEYKNKNKSTYKTDADNFNANYAVDIFRNAKLDFNPGSKKLYTTYGYNLLGAVIDKKTGGYTNWITKNIKNKLGLSSLKVSNGTFYGFQKPKDGVIVQGRDSDKEWVLPGGGWESNIKDLLKFARGIEEGKLLKNTSRLWQTTTKLMSVTKRKKEYNGLESMGKDKKLRVWHGGTHGNLKTLMYIMPNENISVVVMIPVQYADPWNIVRKVVDKMGVNRSPVTGPIDRCGAGMSSSGKKFIGIWQKTNQDVVIRRGYTSNNFNKEWNFMSSKGYHLESFEFSDNLWHGIFKKGRGQYAMWRNYDQNEFNKKWKEMNSKGYRLYDLETYTIGSKRKWAGLFKKGTGQYAMYRNYSTTDFATKRKAMVKRGLKLIDVEVYESKGQLKWSGVWLGQGKEMLNRNYDRAGFYKLNDSRNKSGYKLIDVEVYKSKGREKWAGIWEKTTNAAQFKRLSFCDFMKTHDDYSGKKYELIDLEAY